MNGREIPNMSSASRRRLTPVTISRVNAEHNAESPKHASAGHRLPGKAKVALPPDTDADSFEEVFATNVAEPMSVALGGLLGVAWGCWALLSGGPAWQVVLGLVSAVAGVLVWVSYFLHFHPGAIAGERWTRTRPRRALRALLAKAYVVFLAVAVLAWIINLAFT